MHPLPLQSRLHHNCSGIIQPTNNTHSINDTTWCNWAPFGKSKPSCSSPPLSSALGKGCLCLERAACRGIHPLAISLTGFQIRATTRSSWGPWTMPSSWPMLSACLSGKREAESGTQSGIVQSCCLPLTNLGQWGQRKKGADGSPRWE